MEELPLPITEWAGDMVTTEKKNKKCDCFFPFRKLKLVALFVKCPKVACFELLLSK